MLTDPSVLPISESWKLPAQSILWFCSMFCKCELVWAFQYGVSLIPCRNNMSSRKEHVHLWASRGGEMDAFFGESIEEG